MKVLFLAAEAAPFAKTGGLADVIGSLPKALRGEGLDARVMLPKYGSIPDHFKNRMTRLCQLEVPVGWRRQYCGVELLEYGGVPFYFLDNEYYFKRQGSYYGYSDEAERFAFLCRAALEALPHLGFLPDVIHCHDWHTGMLAPLKQAHYGGHELYSSIRTVFTIHNLAYQGIFPRVVLDDLFSLGSEFFTVDGLEFFGNVSFMKGGLVFSDAVTTVSETHVEEIKTPEFGHGLEGLLRFRARDLHGIINGLDYEVYNPVTDPAIYAQYDSWVGKRPNKLALQTELSLQVDESVPIMAMVTRLAGQKGLTLVEEALDRIMAMNVQMVVLGTGEEHYEAMFRQAAAKFEGRLSANICFDNALAHRIYAGSDLFLMPSAFEPCGLGQLIALRYGSVPIVRATGGLKDTVKPFDQCCCTGNGFAFRNHAASDMLLAIQHALQTYSCPQMWAELVRNAMSSNYAWGNSARQYRNLYEELLDEGECLCPLISLV